MRWLRAGFLPVSLMTLLAGALVVPLPLYLERPGRAVSLAACVDVSYDGATPVDGDYLLMTINVARGTSVDALVGAVEADANVVGRGSIIPPGVDAGTYFRQQREEFITTADVAAAVGLEAAGFETDVSGDGVEVIQTVPDTPAAGVLHAGDIITGVNGQPVSIEAQLREAVAAAPAGEQLTVQVERDGEVVRLQLTPIEADGVPIIGVVPQTVNPRVRLPVAVDVASGRTGGPSAGLTIALTVYDQVLPDVDLAAGRIIAGTGTIDPSGRVGPVGGAGLKVLAADRAGADVFLVPARNHAEAAAALPADSAMEIVAVSTFDQARHALETGVGRIDRDAAAEDRSCPFRST